MRFFKKKPEPKPWYDEPGCTRLPQNKVIYIDFYAGFGITGIVKIDTTTEKATVTVYSKRRESLWRQIAEVRIV